MESGGITCFLSLLVVALTVVFPEADAEFAVRYINPYWYRPVAYGPAPLYGYPSYYPFGATGPVYGRYSWDYNVYFAASVGWYPMNVPSYPYQFPTYSYNWAWKGFGW